MFSQMAFDEGAKITDGKGQSFAQTVLGRLEGHVQKSARPPPHSTRENQLGKDQGPERES